LKVTDTAEAQQTLLTAFLLFHKQDTYNYNYHYKSSYTLENLLLYF